MCLFFIVIYKIFAKITYKASASTLIVDFVKHCVHAFKYENDTVKRLRNSFSSLMWSVGGDALRWITYRTVS